MLYDRRSSLKIRLAAPPPSSELTQNLEINNLRISFSILKSESWSTNNAQIRLWNLSEKNRNLLNQYGDEISLYAGYKFAGGEQLLFKGYTTQLSHDFQFPEIVSLFECGDGEKQLNNTFISISYAAGTSVKEVIRQVAQKMNLIVAFIGNTPDQKYAHGFYGNDLAKNILDKACLKLNMVFSVQNDELYVVDKNVGLNRPPFIINQNTGMIGVPERFFDKKYYLYRALPPNQMRVNQWRVKTLLRPDILPGDKIQLQSIKANIDSEFYVSSIRHNGDTFEGEFQSILEVVQA